MTATISKVDIVRELGARCNTWGKWGTDDQLGAVNDVPPERVLEEVAADCAEIGVSEFQLVAPPLAITRAVGFSVNPQVIN